VPLAKNLLAHNALSQPEPEPADRPVSLFEPIGWFAVKDREPFLRIAYWHGQITSAIGHRNGTNGTVAIVREKAIFLVGSAVF